MRKAKVYVHDKLTGILVELKMEGPYQFNYEKDYMEVPVSLTMPLSQKSYEFETFPSFFEGLLPEGIMLEGLLRQRKIDANDYFSQLLATGDDLVGAVTVKPFANE